MTSIALKRTSSHGEVKFYSSTLFIFTLVFLTLAGKMFSQSPQTFAYTGTVQTYVVPSSGLYQLETWGAQGGANWVNNTNFGGYAKAVYSFSAGTVLNIFVGQKAIGLTGGYNGGGNGEGAGIGGGGASDVRLNGAAFTDRILVGGGGGGAGYWSSLHVVGGVGGGLTGGDGYRNTVVDAGGQGGTQTGSGNGTCVSVNNPATSGGLGFGGSASGCGCEGYGGGGGYYGGAGSGNCRGGGGGSGYISPAGTNTVFTSGVQTGNGQVIITPLFSASVAQTSLACNGMVNGSATVTASGATGPYTYSWIPSGGTNSIATNLAAGAYTCLVIVPGTTIYPVVTISQPAAITSSIISQTNITCNGGNNGSASLTVTGGVAPYTYTWSPSGGNSTSASGLSAGIYTVNIKDLNNCLSAKQVSITQPSTFSISASASSPSICNGSTVSLSGSGATTYTWSGGVTNGVSFSPTITATYSLTAKNASACAASNTAVITVTVHNIPVITVNSGSVCSGKSFTILASGANTYTYSGGTNIVTPSINSSYSVTGTSTAGCSSSSAAISSVSVIALPSVSVNSGSICAGTSFTLAGSGASTYTFTGGNAIVSPAITTSYSVTGTSAAGCVSSNTAVSILTVQALPLISVNSGSVCDGNSFTITSTGANTYTISGGASIVSPTITTSYSVTGTSTAGCVSSNAAVSTVSVFALPVISVNSGSICNGGSFTLNPSGAASYTFSSANTVVSPTITSSYSVSGTSAEGCISSNTAVSTVSVESPPVISVNNATICSGDSFTIRPSGASTYTFTGGGPVVSPAVNSSYSITGSSSNGCLSSNVAISSVVVNALPIVNIQGTSVICLGATSTLTAAGATTYSWNNTLTSSSISVSPSSTTIYSVSGSDANGCKGSALYTLTVNPLPVISFTNSDMICSGEAATITATGAQTYLWNGGETTAVIIVSPVTTTTYSVVGTDINGCVNSAIITQTVGNCTGITNVIENNTNISVYPNPSYGDFTIQVKGEGFLAVTNEMGQTVTVIELNDKNSYSVSLNHLASGIYFLNGTIAGNTIHKKIILVK